MIGHPTKEEANAKSRAAFLIATGLYSGLAPVSPGTVGSIAAVLFWLVLHSLGVPSHPVADTILAAAVTGLGFAAVRNYLTEHLEAEDPGFIVADEWSGMHISLICTAPNDPVGILLAFALFRVLDITKPWLIGRAERLPGAAGIMVDDMLAGATTLLVLLPFSL